MQNSDEESEVARYILAHLLRHNYSQTATAFLQECTSLGRPSVMVLPPTPLKDIISAYKIRKNAALLTSSLGGRQAWTALWERLQHTLQQMNELVGVGLDSRPGASKSGVRPRGPAMRKQLSSKPAPPLTSLATPTRITPTTSVLVTSSSVPHIISDSLPTSISSSPQKRKLQPPKKKATATSAVPPPFPELPPDLQEVLDSLVNSETLPTKLADVINQFVAEGADVPVAMDTGVAPHPVATPTSAPLSSSVSPSVLSQSTLDSILDVACAESWLEDLLGQSPPISLAPATPTTVSMATYTLDQAIPTASTPTTVSMATSALDQANPTSLSTLQTVSNMASSSSSLPWQPLLPIPSVQQQAVTKDEEEPVAKKTRLDPQGLKFSSSFDMEKFLDKLHAQK